MSSSQDQDSEPGRDASRRPYTPPAIVESATFETLALACGKQNGQFSCDPDFGGGGFTNS